MATLADELREDLGDTDSEVEDGQDGLRDDSDDEEHQDRMRGIERTASEPVEEAAKPTPDDHQAFRAGIQELRSSYRLMRDLKVMVGKIDHYQSQPQSTRAVDLLAVKDNPEYELLTSANSQSSIVDTEMLKCHKYIKDHYSARFPELETLITNPLRYAQAVKMLGNGPFDDLRSKKMILDGQTPVSLESIIGGPNMMVVAVEATTTRGHNLTDSELLRIQEACDLMMSFEAARHRMTHYVQSRMSVFAPNLTQLCGSLVAAQLINARGGLREFAETHPGNLPSLGAKNQATAGLATNTGFRKQGYLFDCPVIKTIPPDLRFKAVKKLGNKAHRAALIDLAREFPDGSDGLNMKDQLLEDLEKASRPPPSASVRALPAPDDKPSRKRGGRAARVAKKANAMTELRTLQNRMAFGKEEKEVGYGTGEGTKGMGMIGMQNDGKIRAVQADPRTKLKMSKKLQARLEGSNAARSSGIESVIGGSSSSLGPITGLRSSGVNSSEPDVSGMQSSLSFTPLHGIELVDPLKRDALKRKRKADEDRWFSSGTFTMVGAGANGAVDSDGFKVPGMPPKKKQNMG